MVAIERGDQDETVAVGLNRTMMRRIGGALAERFCAALASADPTGIMPEHAQVLREVTKGA